MQSVKWDVTSTPEENLKEIIGTADKILYHFEVAPYDYHVENRFTPRFFLSTTKLLFQYDEVLEIYNLKDLSFDLMGESPRYTLWQQAMEGSFLYENGNEDSFNKLRQAEAVLRFSFNEANKVPKYFVLRDSTVVQKAFKTWAMAQMIINAKNRAENNLILEEMIGGTFSSFNQKTVLMFALIFTSYFLLRMAANWLIPGFIVQILDYGFALVAIAMGVWLFKSMSKNLEKYEGVYMSYRGGHAYNQSNEIG